MTFIRKFRNYQIVMIQRSNDSIFEVVFQKCVFHRNNSTVTFQFEITGDMVITWDMDVQKLYQVSGTNDRVILVRVGLVFTQLCFSINRRANGNYKKQYN